VPYSKESEQAGGDLGPACRQVGSRRLKPKKSMLVPSKIGRPKLRYLLTDAARILSREGRKIPPSTDNLTSNAEGLRRISRGVIAIFEINRLLCELKYGASAVNSWDRIEKLSNIYRGKMRGRCILCPQQGTL
jgi:hypothetical protein